MVKVKRLFKNLLKNLKKKKKFGEKSLTLILYVVSFCGLSFYVYGICVKFFYEPDIGLSETYRKATSIPFPAVTICSPLVLKSDLVNIKEYFVEGLLKHKIKNLSVSEQNYLAAKAQVCALIMYKHIEPGIPNRTEKSFTKLLNQGGPSIDETFSFCTQRYVSKAKCSSLFRRVLSDLGMCYTFNMQSHSEIFNEDVISSDFDSYKKDDDKNEPAHWTLQDGFSSNATDKIPRRCFLGNGYQFFMQMNKTDILDLCYLLKSTFKVIIHLPNEMPTFFHPAEYIQFSTETILKLGAISYVNDKSLKKYSAESRHCFFEGERKLQFFKTYTKIQCIMECLANFTVRRCGCSKFSFPRTQDTPVCDVSESGCQVKAFYDFPEKDEMSKNFVMPCNCLPPCHDLQYKIKQKQVVELTGESSFVVDKFNKEFNNTKIFSALNIEFGDFQITESKNFVAYTWENFVADCGGLAGLFLGFSIMAVLHFVFRQIRKILIRKQQNKNEQYKENQLPPFIVVQPKNNSNRFTNENINTKLPTYYSREMKERLRMEMLQKRAQTFFTYR